MPIRLPWTAPHQGSRALRHPGAVPAGQRLYAVGDIHGRSDLLDRLLERIRADAAAAPKGVQHTLVLLGDYIDRGPDSRGVVDRLSAGPPPGFGLICLMGNHEETMLRFLAERGTGPGWLRIGGGDTLAGYGIDPPATADLPEGFARAQSALAAALPPRHMGFLRGLRLYLRLGGYLFVHAGIRPGVPLERQRRDDLLWIRDPFLSSSVDHGMVVIHGHTVTPVPDRRANRIGIDTGAWASGVLTACVLEGTEQRFLST
ncbi:MAG: hypothetical protein RLY86_2434 [Pseudomonadota bacterium]|jgi:serine/threonine protein phosphatase 1